MQTPLRITFRHMTQSEALEQRIREKLGKIEKIFPEIIDCDATIEQVDRHQQQGRHFRVAIIVHIPGEGMTANTNNEDVYVALRDAFAAMRRQLEKAIGTRRDSAREPTDHIGQGHGT